MKKILKLDYLLLLPLFITCTLGIIMMYSASSIVAVQHYGYNSRHFVDSQLTKLLLGTIGLIVCALLPYEIWKKRIISISIMVGGIFLLIMVLWKGKVVNNAQSWIFGIQPAEFLKLGTILVTARFFALRQEQAKNNWSGIGKLLFFLATIFFLIFKQPNLGSALLILGIGFSIFLCSGININLLIKRTTIGSILWLPILYYLIQYSLSEVQKTRITTIFNPFVDAQGNGYQLVNSFIAIGSGGITGRGFGNSIQKTGYLPEPHTDFIMAIVSEELGFIGVFIILAGVLTIVLRSLKIAQLCVDPFGSFIAIGIGCMIGMQSVVNLGGITGLFPLTGTPFPFVSFGGSSLMVNLIAIGILINISIFNKIKFDNLNI
ncbi:FtsW/RodA/SpoVE family cell cycle protein [Bacillus cereus]|uniref:FtsW/RodA/SpoVE family cell cycle protein n=1 Tax=Bacillus cereus group TaxID=86661 RepID=UPI000BED389D|nr:MULTISPECIES: FtsW/RodA/SpoVE family cell cycle protein [Bacillus cereus group]MDA2519892.1 FtsW/RodA/SpoVE family cell cycle protein [Bacillus cereus]PEE71094.1 cell division protein FtsW [Bacillus thuringiensis]QFY03213.1 cell division protein FtsW [Bacillus cereus]